MMFSPKIKLDKSLYDRVREASEHAGYASVDEFISHVLEREVSSILEQNEDAQVEQQLRGLGYIE